MQSLQGGSATTDNDHATLAPGVQCGGVGRGIGRAVEAIHHVVATLDGERLAEIEGLHRSGTPLDAAACARYPQRGILRGRVHRRL